MANKLKVFTFVDEHCDGSGDAARIRPTSFKNFEKDLESLLRGLYDETVRWKLSVIENVAVTRFAYDAVSVADIRSVFSEYINLDNNG